MKKILFVLQSVKSGGSTTSMLNLIELLKEKNINTDIFLLKREGVFLERAEKVATVLPEEKIISSILCSKSDLRKRGMFSIIIRAAFVITHKIIGKEKARNLFYKKSAQKLSNQYDTVIAYQESLVTEYVMHIKCKKKIAWVHTDYSRFAIDRTVEYEQSLYNHFNDVICVSRASRKSMLENLELSPDCVHLIYNTIPKNYIMQMASQHIQPLKKNKHTFVSMGRFVPPKGFDRAVKVATRLMEENIDFVWYIIGEGADFECIKNGIVQRNLESRLILLGLKANPFPYIKQADCFIMTSRYEAQPMVLNEALTLGIPVISTRFSSVDEVVDNGINGLIIDNSVEGIYDGIMSFINDAILREKITKGARKFLYDNDTIVNQVENLL